MHPTCERAWVTLAQVEKKAAEPTLDVSRHKAENVLKAGLRHNPKSAAILTALGLHMLQEGDERRDIVAYGLLRVAGEYDPSAKSVLRWKRVREAGSRYRVLRWRARRCRHGICDK